MTEKYWDKKHSEDYNKTNWAKKSSVFAELAVKYFPKAGKILEIGTGQGGDAGFFESLGYKLIATDFSGEALKNARKNFKNIEFIKLDTSKGLPFENKVFDVVYSHMSLHYFDKKTTEKIFKEIHRVLKTDGIFATITNTIADPEKEADGYIELEPGFYQKPEGIAKRYFSIESMKKLTQNLFEVLLLDNKGETYKDDIKTLIRFIGRKNGI